MTTQMPPAPAPTERQSYASAADYAYSALRREIIGSRLRSGHRMREVELTEWLGVSRTPIRQALARLELEGLLEVQPRIGLVVVSIDEDAMDELYEMRGALEGAAAAMAARHASARDLHTLQVLVGLEDSLRRDPEERYRHNVEFHAAIYRAAHNRFLMKSLNALNDAIGLLGPTTMSAVGRLDAAAAEHRTIVEAIAARDGDLAQERARRHVLTALDLRRNMRGA